VASVPIRNFDGSRRRRLTSESRHELAEVVDHDDLGRRGRRAPRRDQHEAFDAGHASLAASAKPAAAPWPASVMCAGVGADLIRVVAGPLDR
jgi:hypothetical protein